VEIRLGIVGGDPIEELRSLRSWLLAEEPLRGVIRHSPTAGEPADMGSVSDLLVVAVGSGGALAVLARSVSTWLEHRHPGVVLEVKGPDGAALRLEAKRSAEAVAVIQAMREPDPRRGRD
jgi:hypothetical protein